MGARWNEGYFVELPYSPGYYRELWPAHLRFCLLLKGLEPPASLRFDYCELTMGKGYSANVHVAANNGRFLGMDFLAAHVSYAKTEDAKELYLASPQTGGGFRISGEEAIRLRQCGLCEHVARNDSAFPQFQLTLLTAHGIIRNRESFPGGES